MGATGRDAEGFRAKYPLGLRNLVSTPMIFREIVMRDAGPLPYPNSALLRDFARFAGYEYGALRAAIARARAAGRLESFVDERGVTRYRTTELVRSVGSVAVAAGSEEGGFLVAVFSFKTEEEESRSRLRDTLKYFGFRRIAQNTYINGLIDSTGLEAELAELGVEENVFLFRCPEAGDPSLARRLGKVFDMEGRAAMLADFLGDLRAFIGPARLGATEFGRRAFYAGPVFHRICFTEEPPFPKSFLPEGYPIAELRRYYADALEKRAKDLESYYLRFAGSAEQDRAGGR